METLLNDLWKNILTYYENLVDLLPKLAIAAVLFGLLLLLARFSRKVARRRLSARMDDPLLARFIARLIGLAIVLFAVMMVLQIVGLGSMAVGILSTAGVGAFILGFAFKDIGENFLAGVVLAFNRPFRVGDVVELNGHKGKVIALNLRDTQIKTFDGKDIYIPNAMVVKNPVVNFTIDGFLRQEFTVGLDYRSDIKRAMEVTLETVRQIPNVLTGEKAPSLAISQLAPSTLNLTVYFWIDTFDKNVSGIVVKNTAIENVLQALEGAGFYLPGDILELRSYRDQELPVHMASAGAGK
ncbi:MAG: mechanosensitive ion channel family protein [Bacteroidetes bacterium]|nr:MAG: mechanosensitive ion channel family protein [Bacteroidota bacterium]